MTKLFRLQSIDLHTGYYNRTNYYENIEIDNPFKADQLIIYFLVYDNPIREDDPKPKSWDDFYQVTEMLENTITDLGTFKQSFDEEEFQFKFDNITLKVLNDNREWDWILSQDTTTEMRVVYYKHTSMTKYNLKGIFYGIVDKSTVSHTNDVGPDDANWKHYREYEFTAIDFLSILREISISELRNSIQEADFWTDGYAVVDREEVINPREDDNGRVPQMSFSAYITVANLFKSIFNLVFSLTTVNIKSDFSFSFTGQNNIWYLDNITKNKNQNICIRAFSLFISDWNREGDIYYTGSFFDDNENIPLHSFFKYENCLTLLKDLLINFGLVWNYTIKVNQIETWQFNFTFNLMSRTHGNLINLNDDILTDIQGNTNKPTINGVAVEVANHGTTTNYINANLRQATGMRGYATYNDKMKKLFTPFISFAKGGSASQCFYVCSNIYALPSLQLINNYTITYLQGSEAYPAGRPTADTEADIHKQYFGEAIANYYAGKYGIYTKSFINNLSFSVDSLEVNLLDRLTIDNKTYTVTQVEKDFLEGTTKIEVVEY
jgi:hypothetical protein